MDDHNSQIVIPPEPPPENPALHRLARLAQQMRQTSILQRSSSGSGSPAGTTLLSNALSPISEAESGLLSIRRWAGEGACPECFCGPDEPGYVRARADAEPGDRDFGRLVPCSTCYAQKKALRIIRQSRLGADYRNLSFADYTKRFGQIEVAQAALAYAEDPRGWLTLYGDYQQGKTSLLAAIAHYIAYRKGFPCLYVTLPELLDMLRGGYEDDFLALMHRMQMVQVLLCDEIDKPNLEKAWAQEKVVQLFEYRYQSRSVLGTAFATNMEPGRRKYVSGDVLGWMFARMSDRRSKIIRVGEP